MPDPAAPTLTPDHRGLAAARAEARHHITELERAAAGTPERSTLPVARVRSLRHAHNDPPASQVPAVSAATLRIPGQHAALTVRVLPPPPGPARGLYLHLHGGGWSLGAADEQDGPLTRLSAATGLRVVSVEYRLAPEHPFPAAPQDCEDAARWLLRDGPSALGTPARWVIGGESAGAHLAVLTLLRLRQRPAPEGRFLAACLSYGWYDLGLTPSARLWTRRLVLSPSDLGWFLDCFLPDTDVERRRQPDLSPLYAPLDDLCPAHFSVGTEDPLLDDTLFMAARWQAAGNRTTQDVWPDTPHGYLTHPLALARIAATRQHTFLNHLLG